MSEQSSTPIAVEKLSTETLKAILSELKESKDHVWIEKSGGTFTVKKLGEVDPFPIPGVSSKESAELKRGQPTDPTAQWHFHNDAFEQFIGQMKKLHEWTGAAPGKQSEFRNAVMSAVPTTEAWQLTHNHMQAEIHTLRYHVRQLEEILSRDGTGIPIQKFK